MTWCSVDKATPRFDEAVTTLLGNSQGEANEIVRAYRSAMIEHMMLGDNEIIYDKP